jgi:hypothetical protein
MTTHTHFNLSKYLAKPQRIGAQDVLRFRREIFDDGIVSRQEAETVLVLNEMASEKCPEWNEFFIEALTDHVVTQAEPRGYVSEEVADWLISMVTRDGKVDSASELELLVAVVSKANRVPEKLEGQVLQTVGRAVLEGEGPLAHGKLTPGVIGEPEVEMIRQVLFAFGGNDGISISKSEAEFLFMLNAHTDEKRNHPAWREFYVKAIANYLMAATTYRAVPRAQAITREDWLADHDADVRGSISRAFSGFGSIFTKGFLNTLFESSHDQIERAWQERNKAQADAETEAERITDSEASWLARKLMQDGIVDENEKALLSHLFAAGAEIPDDLKPLLKRSAG